MATRKNRAPTAESGKLAYFNRELSWLEFNRRVLQQAESDRHPLLERVRFLAIVSSNLDEFFEIRVAGLMQQVDSGLTEFGLDGLTPVEQLRRIHAVVASLVDEQYRCWHQQLVPALAREGILFRPPQDLTKAEVNWVWTYFREQIYPVLTPLALDQSHPFPQLGNKTLNVVVSLESPDANQADGTARHVAILPVPRILPRLITIAPTRPGPKRTIFLSDIIKLCGGELFPGYRLKGAHAFRVTRNSDLYIDEEEVENLLKKIEDELRNLRRGAAVRLEIEKGVDADIFSTLCQHLNLSQEYVYQLHGPINLLRLLSLADMDRPDLKYPPLRRSTSRPCANPRGSSTRCASRRCSFTTLMIRSRRWSTSWSRPRGIPQVVAIKQTLYRTSGDYPDRARADRGLPQRQAGRAALVELRARFDEANNIQWAKQLEEAGVHVVYGLVGHKTHCKLCLVVRSEGRSMRNYAHLGTGNYNPRTAKLYTDLSYFTSRKDITGDVAQLFNTLTGFRADPAVPQPPGRPFQSPQAHP